MAWFGGEPLLYFNEIVYPLSLYAREICKDILFSTQITTNAYLITESMIHKFRDMNLTSLQITLDGEECIHDKIRNEKGKPSFGKIINNIERLCENIPCLNISLRINYTDKSLNSNVLDIFNRIQLKYRHNIAPYFQRVWQTYKENIVVEDNEMLLYIQRECKKMGYLINNINSIYKIGNTHTCYMDRINTVMINYDSKIYSCTARDYSDKYVIGELGCDGKIIWNNTKVANKFGKSTFENERCLSCKHLPICLGPCSQNMTENVDFPNSINCKLDVSEITPETFILERYRLLYNVV